MIRLAFAWFAAALLGCVLPAHADTPISLFQSFRGNVNFTGTEETLRAKDNTKPCSLVSSYYGIYANLTGIPSGATVKSAQLYWAGSGTSGDYTVAFDGVDVSAPTARRYLSKVYANGTVYTYFSGAADVTTQVSKKGNGYYNFSGLSVSTGNPWCAAQGVVGGFALVVVYSHPNEPFRMLNLYEGFQPFQNSSLTINLGSFNVPNPLPSNVTGRVGHITWEGDTTLSQGGEDLLFNGYELTDSINPKGNQFNSASNVTGDTTSYGIDFDIYTLKSPIIQPGQNNATTVYRSGQDLVLLSSEIVAMPYVANADLSLSMTRTGELTVGNSAYYTINVVNNGVDTEVGPVTVVDTLPAGLTFVSASGTNWNCSNAVQANGTTLVTCTQQGPFAPGAKLSPLSIYVSPKTAGNFTNTATVSGKTGDNNSANNTATNTATSVDNGSAALVLTREPCSVDQPVVIGDAPGCHRFTGPVVAGDPNVTIYVTSVKGSLQASAVSTTADTTLTLDFMTKCLPYNKNAALSYANLTLDCQGTYASASVTFPKGQPSVALPFKYADVGRISLSLRMKSSVLGTVDFISKPADIIFESVQRVQGSYPDQKGDFASNWAKDDIGFAKAGEPFLLRIKPVMYDRKTIPPSFGKESDALAGIVAPANLDFAFNVDTFPVIQLGSTRTAIPMDGEASESPFVPDAAGFVATTSAGIYQMGASYFEAGLLALTPWLDDYLGSGPVGRVPTAPGSAGPLFLGSKIVGRFYPDHFMTQVTAAYTDCPAAMNCPSDPSVAVSGFNYSTQPFQFTVTAYALPRTAGADPDQLDRFQVLTNDAASPRYLKLQASKAPNLAGAPAIGGFTVDPSTLLKVPAADAFPPLQGSTAYKLGSPYDYTKRNAGSAVWGVPTAVYLRASMVEARGVLDGTGKPGTAADTITSMTPASGALYEGGLMVVPGRLALANVTGSELMRLPVGLTAQYWTGSTWAPSFTDSQSKVATTMSTVSCSRSFASTGTTCKTGLLGLVDSGNPVQLANGQGGRVLQAPGRGNTGVIDFTAASPEAPWLPSTLSRATFGTFSSPLIYLREVY